MSSLFIRDHVLLAPYTTLEIGGYARWFAEITTESMLLEALTWARNHACRVSVLGGGSNVVISDRGFDGLVLHMAIRGVDFQIVDSNHADVVVAAGEVWDDFVATSISNNYSGLECLSGIPGLVGATPIQNVGAYGQEVSSTITKVRSVDISSLQWHERNNQECMFGYRDSIFKSTLKGSEIVTAVTFSLTHNASFQSTYLELTRALQNKPHTLQNVRDTVLTLRRSKSMVLDSQDPNRRSVGSFFLNPIVSCDQAQRISELALKNSLIHHIDEMPQFKIREVSGFVKLSAAWLIERSGFSKGMRTGNVGISSRHALALVNYGEASSHELLSFAEQIQQKVEHQWGVALHIEPSFL